MKKKVLAILLTVVVVTSMLAGCGNKQILDGTYTFNKAIIELQNGETIEGEVQSWKDYECSELIQVKIDGKTYLVHSSKITLIKE